MITKINMKHISLSENLMNEANACINHSFASIRGDYFNISVCINSNSIQRHHLYNYHIFKKFVFLFDCCFLSYCEYVKNAVNSFEIRPIVTSKNAGTLIDSF